MLDAVDMTLAELPCLPRAAEPNEGCRLPRPRP